MNKSTPRDAKSSKQNITSFSDEIYKKILNPKITNSIRKTKYNLIGDLYPLPDPPVENIVAQPSLYQHSFRFLVNPTSLTFKIGNIEPYFLSMYLYDTNKRVRISETYFFDLNDDEILNLIGGKESFKVKKNITPLFSVNQTTQDIWLIIRVDKILQGDTHDTIAETYSKLENVKEREKEKIEEKVKSFCSKQSKYRQPFCWGFISLFNEEKQLRVGKGTTLSSFYRYKDTVSDSCIIEVLSDFSKLGSKKSRSIPGKLKLDIFEFKDTVHRAKNFIDKDGVNTSMDTKSELNSKEELTFDTIQEISPIPSSPSPFLTYSNILYIYPLDLVFTKSMAQLTPRNIAISVQICEHDNLKSKLKNIYNQNFVDSMTDIIFSNVNYHNKNPQFYDEFKLLLPTKLSTKHNLIFTFYHIACQGKSDQEMQTPFAYAILPIFFNGAIIEKTLNMHLISDIPENYLTSDKEAAQKLVIDEKKAKFKVLIRPESSVYPSGGISSFITECNRVMKKSGNLEKLTISINDLTKVSPLKLFQHLPTILNMLFYVMCNIEDLTRYCFDALITIFNSIITNPETDDYLDLKTALSQYAEYFFTSYFNSLSDSKDKRKTNNSVLTTLFIHLSNAWLHKLKSRSKDYARLHKFAWFFFKLIYASMAAHVLKITHETFNGTISNCTFSFTENRSKLFTNEQLTTLRSLVLLLGWEVQERIKGSLTLSKDLNRRIAQFLCDILSVVDRSFVYELIVSVLKEIAPDEDEECYNLKLDFIKIIVSHEHFPQLNLPTPLEINFNNIGDLSQILIKKHPFAGLLQEILMSPIPANNKSLRMKAIHIIQTLLFKVDCNPLFKDEKFKSQYLQIYFPFILYVIDNFEVYQTRDFDEQRCIYLCFLHIINSIEGKVLQQWWKVDTVSRLHNFLNILTTCSEIFEYVGVKKLINRLTTLVNKEDKSETLRLLENYYSNASNLDNPYKSLREKRLKATKPHSGSTFILRNTSIWRHSGIDSDKNHYLTNETLEANLSNEIAFVVLKLIRMFIECKHSDLSAKQPNTLMNNVFQTLISLLGRKQSIEFILEAFEVLKHIIITFSDHFFRSNTSYCSKAIPIILSYCNFQDSIVRSYASSIFFLFMKENFESSSDKNFTRVKVQSIISLSGLIARNSGITDTTYLNSALEATKKYADSYVKTSKDSSLLKQVDQLVEKIEELLEDNSKIKEHEYDQEMKVDLFHRIAQSYKTAPDLRITWLQSLAKYHEENKSWAEAAQTYIHIAALISEYLQIIEPTKGSIKGAAAFDIVSSSAVDEQTIFDGKYLLEEDGVFETNELFKEDGLINSIETAIRCLNEGELYETAIELYKLLMPIYEKNRNYKKLSEAHQKLGKMYTDIIEVTKNKTRLFGSYYRVGFYGEKFGELNSREFIYKEPKITRLGEIQEKLVNIYSKKLNTQIEIITSSSEVNKSKLDKKKCYIQLTSVSPHLEEWELKERVTDFDRNNNIYRFIFETPFTKNEKNQSNSISDQMKRKTILMVETSFPYVKNRLEVVSKEIYELTPIQNALELITNRTRALQIELENPNPKTLQNVLQGSVRLQVHAGPQEVCKVFLANQSKYDFEDVEKLKIAIQEFIDICGEALAKNKEIINSTQLTFHQELEDGLSEIIKFVEPYLTS